MASYVRGTAINLVENFWTIDPLTDVQTPADPDNVVFTIVTPDGASLVFTWNVDGNVTHPETGTFVCALDPQLPTGVYQYHCDGTGTVDASSADQVFEVIETHVLDQASPSVAVQGPCQQWISGQDVAACARVDYDRLPNTFDQVAYMASMAMYEVSGRLFPGLCERTVRPTRNPVCGCWGTGPVSYGLGPWYWTTVPWGLGGGWAWYNERGDKLGCSPMSKVNLAGYPVAEIVAVTIDGQDLPEFDASSGARNWRLDMRRYLVRMDDPGPPVQPRFWPGCQNMSLDDDQPGTFAVSYRWGTPVPELGRAAAVEVANQLFLACGGQECVLPAGVTRVVRQGIEIERGLLANWMDTTKQTGLVQTDLFLAAYCQGQRRGRRPAVWSPDLQTMARRVGV